MATFTPSMLAVFVILLIAIFLFATEPVPIDITALGIMVSLMLLGPVSGLILTTPLDIISPDQGISGFANAATITVLAMFVLSEGIQRTGAIQVLGHRIAAVTGTSEPRQLLATILAVGPISGFINNTAAVAILIPMVNDIGHKGRVSPSKLLIPLSFASMFGGMFTVIGTSTNILASDLTARLLGEPFSMFEFSLLGVMIFITGSIYLLTIGRYLLPEHIDPEEDLTEEFELTEYLTEVVVREDSPIIGQTVQEAIEATDVDVDVIQLIRDEEVFVEPLRFRVIQGGDIFAIRTDRDTLMELLATEGLDIREDIDVNEAELQRANERENLVEVVIGPGSPLAGESLDSADFRARYDASVLAIRRGGELYRQRMDRLVLRVGDTLLIQGTPEKIRRIVANPSFIVVQEIEHPEYRPHKLPLAITIIIGVVTVAAVGIVPIVVAALTGGLLMVVTGCLQPREVYESVHWDVIFLLAGVIPLGIALEQTGGADLLADLIIGLAPAASPLIMLAVFYIVTSLLTNAISNNAAVVLMIPIAFDAAITMGASPFSFILAVTFAASTAFMTPIGYQTNLFVYGPGGYRFMDFVKVGAPLQLVFTIVTTFGIALIWGV